MCLRLWQSSDPAALLAEKGVQGPARGRAGRGARRVRARRCGCRDRAAQPDGDVGRHAQRHLGGGPAPARHEEDQDMSPALLDEALERLERDSKLVRRERRRDLYLYEITQRVPRPWISRAPRGASASRRSGGAGAGACASAGRSPPGCSSSRCSRESRWRRSPSAREAQRQGEIATRAASDATSLALAASSVEPLHDSPRRRRSRSPSRRTGSSRGRRPTRRSSGPGSRPGGRTCAARSTAATQASTSRSAKAGRSWSPRAMAASISGTRARRSGPAGSRVPVSSPASR